MSVDAVSGVYETAPREVEDQPSFLNAACRIVTGLTPRELLDLVKRLEPELGRIAGPRYGPRAIDLDILLWDGGGWSDDRLVVPHPRLRERRFALVPVLELDPPDAAELAAAEALLDSAEQPVTPTVQRLTTPLAPRP